MYYDKPEIIENFNNDDTHKYINYHRSLICHLKKTEHIVTKPSPTWLRGMTLLRRAHKRESPELFRCLLAADRDQENAAGTFDSFLGHVLELTKTALQPLNWVMSVFCVFNMFSI